MGKTNTGCIAGIAAMSKRFNKYASMGVSYRDGQEDGPKKSRKNNYRRQMNSGNFIGGRQEGGNNSEDLRPQVIRSSRTLTSAVIAA